MTAVVIPARFNGPAGSGHGGYSAGLVAAALGPSATVRLAAPPPLETSMMLEDTEYGVRLMAGDTLVAEARPGRPQIDTPRPVDVAAATRASESYVGLHNHPFPTCFGCGPERAEGDGLRVFPGPAGPDGLLAAPWTPAPDLAEEGVVDPVYVWAALDCPSGFACIPPGSLSVLATMTAEVEAPLHAGETYVITAWPISHDGRKHRGGAAIHDASGHRLAVADTLWITPRNI
jgi:hypothetical protein